MRAIVIGGLMVGGLLLAGERTVAHHSFSAEFDNTQPITLTGIVTKVEWTNPHVWFYINVKDEATGKVANWGGEMGPPHQLQRRGWRRTSLQVGQEVTVNGFRSRNGSTRLSARNVTLTSTGGSPGETLDAAGSGGTANE